MIKRLIKIIFFIPMSVVSLFYFPIAILQWIITGVFPEAPLKYLMEL